MVLFSNRSFTKNAELLKFARSINNKLTNSYSLISYRDNDIYHMIPLQNEIEEFEYQHLISKDILIEQIYCLFDKYHQNIVEKNFDEIADYFPNFTLKEKYKNS